MKLKNNLIRKLFYLILLSHLSVFAFGQITQSDPIEISYTGSDISNPYYVAPSPNVYLKGPKAQIEARYLKKKQNDPEWTPEQKAAVEFAMRILETHLSSDVPIVARFYWSDEFSSNSDKLTTVVAGGGLINFNSTHPAYEDWVHYCQNIAQAMMGYFFGSDFGIQVTFNAKKEWYFGTDGQVGENQYDFVTSVLSNSVNCLGMISGVSDFHNGYPANDEWNYPMTYDRFVSNSQGVRMRSLDNSQANESYYVSDNLFFDGTHTLQANNSEAVKLYAPTTFENGVSVNFLDEILYNNTPSALMTPFLDLKEAIHDLSPIVHGILKDVGWDEPTAIGVEDNLNVVGCAMPPFNDELVTSLNLNSPYSFGWEFIDNAPSGDYLATTPQWEIWLLHKGGKYVYQSATHPQCFEFELSNLPDLEWHRNINGKVRGGIIVKGTDNKGIYHEGKLDIEVNMPPSKPEILLEVTSEPTIRTGRLGLPELDIACDEVKISFFASGAKSYAVYYKPLAAQNYTVVHVPADQYSVKIGGLSSIGTYEFYVEAYNEAGSSSSDFKYRYPCGISVVNLFPNPVVGGGSLVIKTLNEALKITQVTLSAVNSTFERLYNFDEAKDLQTVNTNGLTRGYYIASVLLENGDIHQVKFYVF